MCVLLLQGEAERRPDLPGGAAQQPHPVDGQPGRPERGPPRGHPALPEEGGQLRTEVSTWQASTPPRHQFLTVPRGSSRCLEVPDGSSWFLAVPRGSSVFHMDHRGSSVFHMDHRGSSEFLHVPQGSTWFPYGSVSCGAQFPLERRSVFALCSG